MTLNNPFMGAGDVPSYQMSAIPFLTSSTVAEVGATPIHVSLPNVSRFVIITNPTEHVLQVGFTANGSKGTGGSVSGSAAEQNGDHANYFILSGNQTTGRLELRVKDIFFTRGSGTNSGFSLIAGITPIRNTMFPTLSGSQGYLGIG